MAEIVIGVLSCQCLDRCLPDKETLQREINAWKNARNQKAIRVDWRFTAEYARKKLTYLPPMPPVAAGMLDLIGGEIKFIALHKSRRQPLGPPPVTSSI